MRDSRSLDELREVAPELPTLDEALVFLAGRDVAVHVDLKLTTRLDEVADALARYGLSERAIMSSFHLASLAAVAVHAPRVPIACRCRSIERFTFGRDR